MCLISLISRKGIEIPQFAYKVGYINSQGWFKSGDRGYRIPLNAWTRDTRKCKVRGSCTYNPGFHCFLNFDDALRYRTPSEVVVEVKLDRGRITTFGVQEIIKQWGMVSRSSVNDVVEAKAVVCKRIKIVAIYDRKTGTWEDCADRLLSIQANMAVNLCGSKEEEKCV